MTPRQRRETLEQLRAAAWAWGLIGIACAAAADLNGSGPGALLALVPYLIVEITYQIISRKENQQR